MVDEWENTPGSARSRKSRNADQRGRYRIRVNDQYRITFRFEHRYPEITVRMKEAAMKLCEPPRADHAPRTPAWRDDAALLTWLASW